MYEVNTYQTGNTIRLYCTFKIEENGVETLINPDEVTFIVMNHRYEELESYTLDPATNTEGEGLWFFDFTTPLEEGRFIYQWNGYWDNQ